MVKFSDQKKKHLKALSNAQGVIAAAAMDQRGSLKKSLAKEKGVADDQITDAMMSEFKAIVSKVLTPHASAILLDPEWGLPAAKARAKNAGLILSYEETGYDQSGPGRLPRLLRNWTVRDHVANGANAVKILLYYSPFDDKKVNEFKHAWVERIGVECAFHEIPYFLEFVGYDPKGGDEKGAAFAKQKPDIVIGSIKEFTQDKYHVDVLKVEVPINPAFVQGGRGCKGESVYSKQEALDHFKKASDAATRPFIYLSAGVDDDVFRENLEYAIDAKTRWNGVLCGRATWKQGIPVYAKEGAAAFEAWLQDRGVKNIQALNALLAKANSWESFGA